MLDTCSWVLATASDAVILWKADPLPEASGRKRWGLALQETWSFEVVTNLAEWESVPTRWACSEVEAGL